MELCGVVHLNGIYRGEAVPFWHLNGCGPPYNMFSTSHSVFCLFDSYSDEILLSAFLIGYRMSGAIRYFRGAEWWESVCEG